MWLSFLIPLPFLDVGTMMRPCVTWRSATRSRATWLNLAPVLASVSTRRHRSPSQPPSASTRGRRRSPGARRVGQGRPSRACGDDASTVASPCLMIVGISAGNCDRCFLAAMLRAALKSLMMRRTVDGDSCGRATFQSSAPSWASVSSCNASISDIVRENMQGKPVLRISPRTVLSSLACIAHRDIGFDHRAYGWRRTIDRGAIRGAPSANFGVCGLLGLLVVENVDAVGIQHVIGDAKLFWR